MALMIELNEIQGGVHFILARSSNLNRGGGVLK